MRTLTESQRNSQSQMLDILALLREETNNDIDVFVAYLESNLDHLETKLGEALIQYKSRRQELLQKTLEQIEDINNSPLIATVPNGNGAVAHTK